MPRIATLSDAQRELAIEGTILPKLPEFPIHAGRTALLTIDMQYMDAHPDHGLGRRATEQGRGELLRPFFEDVAALIPKIQDLQAAARRSGVEVIHVRIAPETEDGRDCPAVSRMRKARFPRSSRESDILDEVGPRGDEMVLSKNTSSAFLSTNLERILRNLGVDTLICCGVVTNGCVESTVRNARDLGFMPVVASDCCATWTRELNHRALRYMATSCANVRTSGQIAASITE